MPDYDLIPCRGCGKLVGTVYCGECAKGLRCPHGEKVGECDQCDRDGDLANDAMRERIAVIWRD